jgi:hypothetical protein
MLPVCLFFPPINFWMPELIFTKLGTYIMVPHPISSAYFINRIILRVHPVVATQRLGINFTVGRVVLYMIRVVSNESSRLVISRTSTLIYGFLNDAAISSYIYNWGKPRRNCAVMIAGAPSKNSTRPLPSQKCHSTRRLTWYLLTYGAEPFLRSCQLYSHSRTSQHFMEPEDSLPSWWEPSSGPYPKPDRSSPYHPILCL